MVYFPFYSSINSNINLPYSLTLLDDDLKMNSYSIKKETKGYNFIYFLFSTTSLSSTRIDNNKVANFKSKFEDLNSLTNSISYEKVNNIYNILKPFSVEGIPKDVKKKNNSNVITIYLFTLLS